MTPGREATVPRAAERVVDGELPRLEAGWPGEPVVAGVTTRELDFGATAGVVGREAIEARRALRRWADGRFGLLVGAAQVHGARLFRADGIAVPDAAEDDPPVTLFLEGYDGFLSDERGVLLTIGVADCVPAVVWAPDAGAVALLHAGWRGVAKEIVPRAIAALTAVYGAEPGRMLAWWGPGIGVECYPVGEEVLAAIRATSAGPGTDGWVEPGPDGPRVDLRAALARQAVAAGMSVARVTRSPRCTACDADLFHSYRRAAGAGGRMRAFAGVPAE